MLTNFSNPTQIPDLTKAKNVAIVTVSVVIPLDGVRAGDHLDVHVASMASATSLLHGELFISPMLGLQPPGSKKPSPIYAFHTGRWKSRTPPR